MPQKFGYFDDTMQEYIITNPQTPRHWYNYLWNDKYNSFVSQTGYGESILQREMGNRISHVGARYIYIKDSQSGNFWTANALPVDIKKDNYSCRHGMGYTEISATQNAISSNWRIVVPKSHGCEIWTLTLKNEGSVSRQLEIFPYVQTLIDGPNKPQAYFTVHGSYDLQAQAVWAYVKWPFESYGYLCALTRPQGYDCRYSSFIGNLHDENRPMAVVNGTCSNGDCESEKVAFAFQHSVTLAPGEQVRLDWFTGVAAGIDEISTIRAALPNADSVDKEIDSTVRSIKSTLGGVKITTEDPNLNSFFNTWLKRQTSMGTEWARVRHNGYRDRVQDCDQFSVVNSSAALERLKVPLAIQYSNGYAPRTWLNGQILDKHSSDNTVWITFAVYSILMETGDSSILDLPVPFNDGSVATIYEHVKRSVDFLWNFKGLYGLIKIWGHDWNDGMSGVGVDGKGVSSWLSMAWCRANAQFREIAVLKGEHSDAELARQRGEEMSQLINQHCWDGDYYLRAFTDEGKPVGSHICEEGKVYINPQSWAVISGVAPQDRALRAMQAAEKVLDSPIGCYINDPYTHFYPNLGGFTAKRPGAYENGGVYLHASAFKLVADCMLKRFDKVEDGLRKILPFDSTFAEKVCEPYVLSNCYFGPGSGYRFGTAGQSWLTGSAGWVMRAIAQYMFGLYPLLDGLHIDPCLPASWKTASIQKSFRNATYSISFTRCDTLRSRTKPEIEINGIHHTGVLPYEQGKSFSVTVKV